MANRLIGSAYQKDRRTHTTRHLYVARNIPHRPYSYQEAWISSNFDTYVREYQITLAFIYQSLVVANESERFESEDDTLRLHVIRRLNGRVCDSTFTRDKLSKPICWTASHNRSARPWISFWLQPLTRACFANHGRYWVSDHSKSSCSTDTILKTPSLVLALPNSIFVQMS